MRLCNWKDWNVFSSSIIDIANESFFLYLLSAFAYRKIIINRMPTNRGNSKMVDYILLNFIPCFVVVFCRFFFSFSLQFYAYRLLSMSVFVHFVFFSTIFCDFRNRKCISCVIMLEFNWYLVGEQHLCAGLKHFVLNHLEQIVCEITSKFILISIRMSAHHVVVCSVFFSINCWTAFVCATGESWKKHQKWKTTWNASDNRIIKFTNTKHLCVRQRTKCTHKISTLS